MTRLLLPLAAALIAAAPAFAADRYPSKPVRLIVPYAPGGGSDITARAIAQKLSDAWGQTVLVDNRPGAASLVGTEIVARASPDGYTLILADVPHSINASIYTKPRYDAIRDFAPITMVATTPRVLVAHPSFDANTLKELLAWPRSKTEKLALGTSGQGSAPHMTYEYLRTLTGLTLNHVPYKGGGPALADVVAGQIPLVFNGAPPTIPHLKAGRVKALGITSAERHRLLPDVPTFQESGVKDFVTIHWYGVLARGGTPRGVVDMLNREILKALHAPDVRERFAALALDITPSSPEVFGQVISRDVTIWKDVVRKTGVRLD